MLSEEYESFWAPALYRAHIIHGSYLWSLCAQISYMLDNSFNPTSKYFIWISSSRQCLIFTPFYELNINLKINKSFHGINFLLLDAILKKKMLRSWVKPTEVRFGRNGKSALCICCRQSSSQKGNYNSMVLSGSWNSGIILKSHILLL